MSAADILVSLTVLLEMHIEVVFHALLSKDGVWEADTALFALCR
jgi:hypothetical protein